MLKRVLASLLGLLLLVTIAAPVGADDPVHPDSDWLTWIASDAAGNQVNLQGYQNQSTFVLVFSASNGEAAKMMRMAAVYVRDHPNQANKVLAMCCDDTAATALKLHLRQEEWRKRVDDWEEDQATARQAAEQAEQEFVPDEMPNFLDAILEELDDPEDLDTLMNYHFPFKTASYCEAMWDWVSERREGASEVGFILKVSSAGEVLQQWSAAENISAVLGN